MAENSKKKKYCENSGRPKQINIQAYNHDRKRKLSERRFREEVYTAIWKIYHLAEAASTIHQQRPGPPKFT